MNGTLQAFLTFLMAYLIGSIPTAYYVGRINGIDIFSTGSGNMGTTNVIRSLGVKWGVLVFAIDALKGVLAVALAWLLPGDALSNGVLAAIGAVVGHNWSLIATQITGTIRGGKGAATATGTWLIMMSPWPQIIVVTIAVWGAVVIMTRYMSLGVLVAFGVATIWVLILIGQNNTGIPYYYNWYTLGLCSLVYYRHRENIFRLLQGRERKLGEKAK
jgi:glycerol-3-phosphate acyltransferase PlsY